MAALLAPAEQAVPADRPTPVESTAPAFTADADIADSDRATPAEAPGLAALQSEVDVLRARVETLEAQPGGSPGLPAVRAALADAEARLAAAEREAAANPLAASPVETDTAVPSRENAPQGATDFFADVAADAGPGQPAAVQDPAPVAARRPYHDGGVDRDESWMAAVESAGDVAPDHDPDYEAPGKERDGAGMFTAMMDLLPGVVSGADGSVALPEETLNWTLIYTARAGDGPWAAE